MRADRDRIEPEPAPLAILAGRGVFPRLVAEAAIRRGRPVTVFAIRGEAESAVEAFPHRWLGRGQLGTLFRGMRKAGARDLCIIGGIRERRLPRFGEVDLTGLIEVIRHRKILFQGDDGLLRTLALIFERRGLRLVGADEIAPELLIAPGPLGRLEPAVGDFADIDAGLAAARAHGAADLGQAVIVVGGEVVAREGTDGTDAMIARFGESRMLVEEPSGVLVKCAKPTQDRRFDLPAIGPATVLGAARAGLAGLAVEAGSALIADEALTREVADTRGIFVYGIDGARHG